MPVTRRVRFGLWVGLVALILMGQPVWMAMLRGPRVLDHDALLIGGHLLFTAALAAMLLLLRTTPGDAIRLKPVISRAIILIGAVILQGAAIVLLWPGLSDDLVRYRLEGRMWLDGVSPYATSPADYMASHPQAVDGIDRTITYAQMQTIYPPVAQAMFTAGRWIEQVVATTLQAEPPAETAASWRELLGALPGWRRGLVFRVMLGATAIAATAVLLRLLQAHGRSPWYAALAAWHPLTIVECGGMGHADVLGVALILAAMLDALRSRARTAGVLLGLAMAVKPQAALLLPFLWRQTWESRRASRWALPLAAIGVAGVLYAAALIYQSGYTGWSHTTATYSRHWEANGSIYELLKWSIGRDDDHQIVLAKRIARSIPPVIVLITGVLLWRRGAAPSTAMYALNLALLLPSATVYPWYLLWMLWMIPLLQPPAGWSGLIWSGTVAISYLLWHQPTWNLPAWASVAEYTPVYVVVAAEGAIALRGRSDRSPQLRVASC